MSAEALHLRAQRDFDTTKLKLRLLTCFRHASSFVDRSFISLMVLRCLRGKLSATDPGQRTIFRMLLNTSESMMVRSWLKLLATLMFLVLFPGLFSSLRGRKRVAPESNENDLPPSNRQRTEADLIPTTSYSTLTKASSAGPSRLPLGLTSSTYPQQPYTYPSNVHSSRPTYLDYYTSPFTCLSSSQAVVNRSPIPTANFYSTNSYNTGPAHTHSITLIA